MGYAIQICRDARAAHWQLGPLPPERGRLTLVAWTGSLSAQDAGVPPEVGNMLARSWTSIASVMFMSSASGVTATRQPDVAVRAFEDPGFPWWLQAQALLLSDPAADPPNIDEPTLLALLAEDWVARAAALETKGVQGVVRPGVDGDVAGLLALSDSFDVRLIASLEREARQAGMDMAIVSESALGEERSAG